MSLVFGLPDMRRAGIVYVWEPFLRARSPYFLKKTHYDEYAELVNVPDGSLWEYKPYHDYHQGLKERLRQRLGGKVVVWLPSSVEQIPSGREQRKLLGSDLFVDNNPLASHVEGKMIGYQRRSGDELTFDKTVYIQLGGMLQAYRSTERGLLVPVETPPSLVRETLFGDFADMLEEDLLMRYVVGNAIAYIESLHLPSDVAVYETHPMRKLVAHARATRSTFKTLKVAQMILRKRYGIETDATQRRIMRNTRRSKQGEIDKSALGTLPTLVKASETKPILVH